MLNIGAGEMIVIALVLLMAVGPEQLPGLIRRVGRTVSEVRGMTEGLRSEFMSGLEEIEKATDPEAWAASNDEPTKVKPLAHRRPSPSAETANGEGSEEGDDGTATPAAVFPEADPDHGDDGVEVSGSGDRNGTGTNGSSATADFTVGTWDGGRSTSDPPVDSVTEDLASAGEQANPGGSAEMRDEEAEERP